ncbi:sarcosine oxidase subunit delta [Sphingomonas sp. MMS24-J45]|uniref:sarcosine oxidase subunit delta n=1 Tax=Sphingomonas sp. MMS24-J45 TaxID=3238806 RepID=UPI00384D25EA
MLQIDCPLCGPRAQVEFVYERTLDSIVTLDMTAEETVARLYARTNPRGVDSELWRHSFGCRQWIVLERDRISHAIVSVAEYGR